MGLETYSAPRWEYLHVVRSGAIRRSVSWGLSPSKNHSPKASRRRNDCLTTQTPRPDGILATSTPPARPCSAPCFAVSPGSTRQSLSFFRCVLVGKNRSCQWYVFLLKEKEPRNAHGPCYGMIRTHWSRLRTRRGRFWHCFRIPRHSHIENMGHSNKCILSTVTSGNPDPCKPMRRLMVVAFGFVKRRIR